MKPYSIILFWGILVSLASCEDPNSDPFQFKNAKQGALIALRGQAYENLNEGDFLGAVDSFSVSQPITNETFDFDAEYISKTVDNLSKIEVYAKFKQEERVKVATVEGNTFQIEQGGRYPNGKITVPLSDILTAIGKQVKDLQPEDMIRIESDLVLSDGSIVPASSIVNSSLSESAFFFPAHSLLYKAGY